MLGAIEAISEEGSHTVVLTLSQPSVLILDALTNEIRRDLPDDG